MKQQFVVNHTILKTEILALPDSWVWNTPSIKMRYPQTIACVYMSIHSWPVQFVSYPVRTCVGGPRLIAVSLVMYESIGNTEGSNIESKKLNVKSYHQKRKKVKQTRIWIISKSCLPKYLHKALKALGTVHIGRIVRKYYYDIIVVLNAVCTQIAWCTAR